MPAQVDVLARTGHDDVEQIPYGAVRFQRVPEPPLGVDHVAILPSDPFALQIPRRLQLGNDPLDRTLRNAHRNGHFAEGLLRLAGEANQYMRVIR